MTLTEVSDPLGTLADARRAFVVPDLKILFISVSKNACTSLKWLISELSGEDPQQFVVGVGPFLSDVEGIHMRSRWEKTPTLDRIPRQVRGEISPENGWFVFGVVRDPRPRLFSAWQNKLLMRNPAYLHWRDQPWYPRVPRGPEDVVEDFARFVGLMASQPDAPVLEDPHFQPQVRYLSEDVVPYSAIYEIGNLDMLVTDLEDHVHRQGWQGQLRLRRSNDTPLRARADVFADPVREQAETFYREDLERFGELWDLGSLESVPPWSTDAIQGLRAQIAMSERIGGLISLVKEERVVSVRRDQRIDTLTLRLGKARAAVARRNKWIDRHILRLGKAQAAVARRDQRIDRLTRELAEARAGHDHLPLAAADPARKSVARRFVSRVRLWLGSRSRR